jgi:hypothetical protein
MKFKETFFKSMDQFKRLRIRIWEKEYDKSVRIQDELKDFDVVHDKLMELLGPEHGTLLIKYTDMICAKYNVDPAFYYNAGYQDCVATYDLYRAILAGKEAIPELEDKADAEIAEELDRLINM